MKTYKISRLASNTKARKIEVNFDTILGLIVSHQYSGSTFKDGYRKLDNFEQAELIIIDIDASLSLEEAKERLDKHGYQHILATTKSHQKEKTTKKGAKIPACDRFRIILFLDKPITNARDFKHTYLQLLNEFPELDSSCAEASRLFYPSKEIISINPTGKTVKVLVAPNSTQTELNNSPAGFGVLSASTKNFLTGGAEPGKWNNALFKAALDLNEQGYPYEVAKLMLNGIQDPLDSTDISTLESAYDREPKYGKRQNKALTIDGFDQKIDKDIEIIETWENIKIPLTKSSVSDWLEDLFYVNQFTIDDRHNFLINEKETDFSVFRDLIYLASDRQMKYKKVKDDWKLTKAPNTSRGLIDSFINHWLGKERKIMFDKVSALIKYNGSNDEVDKFVNHITDENKELTAAILKQFIYNVKLKILKKHPKFIIMPVVVGKQGVGKSLAIKKFLEPIKHLCAPTNFDVFKDERKFNGLFGGKLVLEFDEMSRATKADIEAVKNKITSEFYNYRIMRTTEDATVFNRASMIGTSNSNLKDLLFDDSGKRRFYEIVCKNENFWNKLNEIDSVKIWQSVDINQPPPILNHLDKLNIVQAKYTNQDSVQEFLMDEDLILENQNKGEFIKQKDLYRQYVEWISEQKRIPFGKQKFYEKARGLLQVKMRGARNNGFIINIASESE